MNYFTRYGIVVSPQQGLRVLAWENVICDELALPVAKGYMLVAVHVKILLLYARPRKSLRI